MICYAAEVKSEPIYCDTRKRFACSFESCSEKFPDIHKKKAHEETHHEEPHFMCSMCKNVYTSNSSLH